MADSTKAGWVHGLDRGKYQHRIIDLSTKDIVSGPNITLLTYLNTLRTSNRGQHRYKLQNGQIYWGVCVGGGGGGGVLCHCLSPTHPPL